MSRKPELSHFKGVRKQCFDKNSGCNNCGVLEKGENRLDIWYIVFGCIVFFASALLQGLSGFGFSILAIPLITMIMSPKVTTDPMITNMMTPPMANSGFPCAAYAVSGCTGKHND